MCKYDEITIKEIILCTYKNHILSRMQKKDSGELAFVTIYDFIIS